MLYFFYNDIRDLLISIKKDFKYILFKNNLRKVYFYIFLQNNILKMLKLINIKKKMIHNI